MEPQPYSPGDGSVEPLPAQGPVPPGSDVEDVVDALDDRIREAGPDEVEEADEQADEAAAEGRPDDEPPG
jgi:hypothetical protein